MKQRADFYRILGSRREPKPFLRVEVDCIEDITKRLPKTYNRLQHEHGWYLEKDYTVISYVVH